MMDWFIHHARNASDIETGARLKFPLEKPPAFVGIDDRVITFHGSWPDVQELRAFKTWMQNPLGATNTHPRGKFNDADEGELRLGIAHKDGTVIIDFGKATAWIGLDAESARNFARLILDHANQL